MATLLCIAPSILQAQQDPRLFPGARLRVNSVDELWQRTPARFVAMRGDTLLVKRPGDAEVRLPLLYLRQVQVVSRPARRTSSTLLGMAVGAAAGYFIRKSILDARYTDDEWNSLGALVVGAPLGLVGGAVVGYQLGGERWETIHIADSTGR